jgi:hypothetical protein
MHRSLLETVVPAIADALVLTRSYRAVPPNHYCGEAVLWQAGARFRRIYAPTLTARCLAPSGLGTERICPQHRQLPVRSVPRDLIEGNSFGDAEADGAACQETEEPPQVPFEPGRMGRITLME